MPRSIFLGRGWPAPGEPLFLKDDTDWALALAEEEAEACPMCGLPRSVCRDPAYQFAFEPAESVCWATYRLAGHQRSDRWTSKLDDTRAATSLSARFREGHEAPLGAGLGLEDEHQHDEHHEQAAKNHQHGVDVL